MATDKLLDTLTANAASASLTLDGASITPTLNPRRFSTGSAGYSWQGKVEGADGRRYQVSVQAVLIGSKGEGA